MSGQPLELSLFVVLYADRIGVLGVYWIPESLVCHGHPPHGAAPPPLPSHLTSSPQYTECRWSFLSCWTVPESAFSYYSGHLVPSLWDLHMFYFLRPILFPNLLFLRTMLFEYLSVLSRFCLFLLQTIWIKLKEILKKNDVCVWMICSSLISLNKWMTLCLFKVHVDMRPPPTAIPPPFLPKYNMYRTNWKTERQTEEMNKRTNAWSVGQTETRQGDNWHL